MAPRKMTENLRKIGARLNLFIYPA